MRVLISGAGIAGPTLAWWLAKTGAHITVVDISREFLTQGQNIDIKGPAIRIIQKMGIEERVKQLNTTEQGTRIVDARGRVLARFDMTEGGPSPTSPYEILRGDLAMILGEATKDAANVEYLFETSVKEVLSNNENSVKVELSNGETREFDLAVAADGQWSNLRKKCFDPSITTVVDRGAFFSFFTVPREAHDTNHWCLHLALKRRVVIRRPDCHGTTRAAFSLMPCSDKQKEAWERASRGSREEQIALIKSDFADVGGEAPRYLAALDAAPDLYVQGIKQIRMSKWSTGRVVCLGDAAYAPSPLGGAGTALAITGAYVLAGELSKLAAGEHPARAFEAYEAAMRPYVTRNQDIPPIMPGAFHPYSAWQRWLLQSGIQMLSRAVQVSFVARRLAEDDSAEALEKEFSLPAYTALSVGA